MIDDTDFRNVLMDWKLKLPLAAQRKSFSVIRPNKYLHLYNIYLKVEAPDKESRHFICSKKKIIMNCDEMSPFKGINSIQGLTEAIAKFEQGFYLKIENASSVIQDLEVPVRPKYPAQLTEKHLDLLTECYLRKTLGKEPLSVASVGQIKLLYGKYLETEWYDNPVTGKRFMAIILTPIGREIVENS